MSRSGLAVRWLPYAAVITFIIAKIPHLYYPFYWDESWVYAPAIFHMYAAGPGLLPGIIPADYSRGHPLLYHCACATWMHVFGNSHFSMHCFALTVSATFAIALYEIMLKLFGSRPALISLAILLPSISFYANSSFLLTDIALALFMLLSLYSYLRDRYVLTAIFLTCALFTKESGLVTCILIGADILWRIATRQLPSRKTCYTCAALLLPICLMAAFLITQHRTYGWYLYPSHISAIDLSLNNIFFNINRSISVLFYEDHIWWLYALFTLLTLIAAVQQRSVRYLMPVALIALLYACLLIFSYKDLIFYLFTARCGVAWLLFLYKPLPGYSSAGQRFIKLLLSLSCLYTLFCCVNFFEARYLLPSLFFIACILLVLALDHIISQLRIRMFAAVLIIIVGLGIYNFTLPSDSLAVYSRMMVQQQLVTYMEQHNYYNEHIYSKPFLEAIHLSDVKTGFLHTRRSFLHITPSLTDTTTLVIADNIELDEQARAQVLADTSLELLKRFQENSEWAAIYLRR